MELIGIYEAKTRLSEMVRDALNGKEVIITRHGKPVVRLVPVQTMEGKRELGFFAGQIRIAEDFDATPSDFKDYA
jgi:prevent-host-death family protein